jgi:CDP-diglyceride synthetase
MAIDFSWVYNPFFMICSEIYFLTFAILVFRYSIKSKNDPKKKDHPEYFINEMIIGFMLLFIVISFPFMFNRWAPDDFIRAQIYFHVWDSLTIHLIGWRVHFYLAKKNNIKYDRFIDYEKWKEQICEDYTTRDGFRSDLKRKLGHIIPPVLVIGMYYVGILMDPILQPYGWSGELLAIYGAVIFGLHYLFLMLHADLYRLQKFDKLGKFARGWCESSIHPSELETLTSANILMLSYIPFYFAPLSISFTVVVVGALADAMASTIGKKFGKKRNPRSPKTVEGYIGGAVSTYILIILMNLIIPLENVTPLLLQAIAICSAIGFFLVDYFAKNISDNFLNSIVVGTIMWSMLAIFSAL